MENKKKVTKDKKKKDWKKEAEAREGKARRQTKRMERITERKKQGKGVNKKKKKTSDQKEGLINGCK